MSKLNILIVENPNNVEIGLSSRLSTMGFNVVGQLTKTTDVADFINENEVDIIISDDFSKSEKNAIHLANEVSQKYEIPLVLLVSDENALDYEKSTAKCMMIKPVNDVELMTNLILAHKSTKANPEQQDIDKLEYLFVRADYKLNKIRINDIYFIEAKKDYVNIHTSDNVYRVHSTMKEMEKNIKSQYLVRIHRSYIVNIDKIFSIKYPELIVEDKMKSLNIGGLYRKSLYNKINII